MNDLKRFGSMTVHSGTLFFVSCNDIFPGLYKVDLIDRTVECLGELPWETYYDENALLEQIGDVIVIAPRWHKRRFIVYDMKLHTFETVFLNQEVWSGDTSVSAFSNVIRFKDSLLFVGNKNGVVVEYNSKIREFFVHKLLIPKNISKHDLSFFWESAIIRKNLLYLPIKKGGILEVDLVNYHSDYIKFTEKYQAFNLNCIENILWIMPYYGKQIILIDLKTGKHELICFSTQEKITPFMTTVDYGKEILLFPMFDKCILSVDKSNYKISEKHGFKMNALEENQTERQFSAIYKDSKQNVYLQKNGSSKIWILNREGFFSEVSIRIPFENIKNIYKSSKAIKRIFLTERKEIKFDTMMQILEMKQYEEQTINKKVGENIWRFLRSKNE